MPPPKRPHLRTIVLAASKGGVGKTTLASALAVRAAADGSKVALLDTDPTASLARWHELRGLPANPKIMEVDAASEALELLRAQRWDWLIVDTPPLFLDRIEIAISIADLAIIPAQPSALDLEAVHDVVRLCRDHAKPFVFILNKVNVQRAKLNESARRYLAPDGPVLQTEIGDRTAYVTAMTLGKSGPEMRDRAAAKEIDALWAELQGAIRHVHP